MGIQPGEKNEEINTDVPTCQYLGAHARAEVSSVFVIGPSYQSQTEALAPSLPSPPLCPSYSASPPSVLRGSRPVLIFISQCVCVDVDVEHQHFPLGGWGVDVVPHTCPFVSVAAVVASVIMWSMVGNSMLFSPILHGLWDLVPGHPLSGSALVLASILNPVLGTSTSSFPQVARCSSNPPLGCVWL